MAENGVLQCTINVFTKFEYNSSSKTVEENEQHKIINILYTDKHSRMDGQSANTPRKKLFYKINMIILDQGTGLPYTLHRK